MFHRHLGRVASLMLVVLAACSTTNRVVTLQHSETGETAECREQPWADQSRSKQAQACVSAYVIDCRVEPRGHIDRKRQMDACISAFQRDGYVIVQDSEAEKK